MNGINPASLIAALAGGGGGGGGGNFGGFPTPFDTNAQGLDPIGQWAAHENVVGNMAAGAGPGAPNTPGNTSVTASMAGGRLGVAEQQIQRESQFLQALNSIFNQQGGNNGGFTQGVQSASQQPGSQDQSVTPQAPDNTDASNTVAGLGGSFFG